MKKEVGFTDFLFFIHRDGSLNPIDKRAISIIGTEISISDIFVYKDSEMDHFIYDLCDEKDAKSKSLK